MTEANQSRNDTGDDITIDVEQDAQRELDEILDELCVTVAGAYELAFRKWERVKSEQ